jgi:hypothetical protein
MGRTLFTAPLGLALFLCAAPVHAQSRDAGGLPGDIGAEIATLFNSPASVRRSGTTVIPRDSTVTGTLAVRTGPVTVAGHITGTLLAINADVRLQAGARIDGGVIVVGGGLEGRDAATIGGDVRIYAETMRYRMTNDELVVDEMHELPLIATDDRYWQRGHDGNRTSFDMFAINGANTYNRVEGLPIIIGPRLRATRSWGSALFQARGIVRTAEPVIWNRQSLGHDMRAEMRWGQSVGLGVGATAFDRVDPIESWQMGDTESGLAAVLIHRDYRDYYARHGASGYVKAYPSGDAALTLSYSGERWESRAARHPWSLFRDDETWPLNPDVDEGFAHLVTAALDVDSRHARYSPAAGWYVHGDIERGELVPAPAPVVPGSPFSTEGTRNYTRGFLDIRRYNRVAPRAQLNVRVVLGGWLGGDELPLERRLSVSGPATLPGFDYRSSTPGVEDRMQCSESGSQGSGLPALCDRVALFQVEYRGDLSWTLGRDHGQRWWPAELRTPTWSVFFDAGRGWRAKDDGVTTYPIQAFPALSTFNSDAGIGLDFGPLSIALATSVSDHHLPLNVVVRLSPRF